MRIAIFSNTPAQIHFYKNIASDLQRRGHKIKFLLRDYKETIAVANELGIEYFIYSKAVSSKIGRSWAFPGRMVRAIRFLKEFKPDILMGFGVYDAYSSALLCKPCIEFADSEPSINTVYTLQLKMYVPFVDTLITPESFLDDLGERQIRIKGFKELAYLHNNYLKTDESIFDILGLEKNEDFVVMRFNAFDAVHDVGVRGFAFEHKRKLVKELEKDASIFISSEGRVSKDFEKYLLKTPFHRIHDVLYYAKLLIGDSQTMTTEAGILGTPAIRCNSFVGENDMSNFSELENKYGLIFNFENPEKALEKAVELIHNPNLKQEWKMKRERLLRDKIDVTKFMVWFIENYPESMRIMKQEPESQLRFK